MDYLTYCVCLMAVFKMSSINVEGLHDQSKRINIFKNLINDKYDIIALQETHCTKEVENLWKEEWPGKSYWTTGSANRTGLAFLFNERLDVNILDDDPDVHGRILRLTVQIDHTKVQLINIYGKNPKNEPDSEYFFEQIDQHILSEPTPLMFGDYNMVEDFKKDRKGGTPRKYHTYGLKALQELKDLHDLVDIWRIKHPNKRNFTWHSRSKDIHSRLDRIYIPSNLIDMVSRIYIKNFIWSDHDMCVLECTLPGAKKRGKGTWKLNIEYLGHERYRSKINDFWKEWKREKEKYEDLQMWWDLGKIYVKSISIQYAQEIYNIRKQEQKSLTEELNNENAKIDTDKEKVDLIHKKLHDLEMEKSKKIFIHTHTEVRETDEEPSKYFYSLLATKQKQSAMHTIINDERVILTEQNEIMSEARNFYKNLYTKEKEISIPEQNKFLKKIDKKLSKEQKQKLESDIEMKDLEEALRDTQKEKAAGDDGLPYEFYHTFWNILKEDFLQVTKFSLYTIGNLTASQSRSLITLIYKKGGKQRLINWRPISLLCTDYKIISKALANRLKNVLDTILSNTQTAGVPNRTIFNNLFLTRDIIEYCKKKKINAYILSIDQEKAFDKLNREFLVKILEKMNFGQRFIECIKAMYKNNKGIVLINGFMSMEFDIDRGLRQGCPISSMLYSIYIEPLALGIKSDPNIKGIPIPGGKTHILTQFADDMDLLLSEKTRLHDVFQILKSFQDATGSTINPDKTKGLCLGTPKMDDPELKNINWEHHGKNVRNALEVLGIIFFDNYAETQDYNWTQVVEQTKTQLINLKKRKLSLKGKVLVLNTVVMAKVWYLATVISMPEEKEQEIRTAIFEFLWDGQNKNPIKQNAVFQPKEKGGLNLKSPKRQQDALQMKYIKQLTDKDEKAPWTYLARYWLGFNLAPLKQEWSFLRGNDFPKPETNKYMTKPKYYAQMLENIRNMDMNQIIWTTPYIYQELTKKQYQIPKACNDKWSKLGYKPECIWKLLFASYAQGCHQDVHYKLLHRVIPSKAYVSNRYGQRGLHFNRMNTACKTCPESLETNEHIFFQCEQAKSIWTYIYPTIQEILKPNKFKIFDLVLNKFPDKITIQKTKMVITLIQIALHAIWLTRNSTLFYRVQDQRTLTKNKNIIAYTFSKIFQKKLRQYMPGGLAKYRENFCHTPNVCTIIENKIVKVQLI